ncbi:cupin domain-containing protein [Streptomyces sp. NBC_01450]|uniref:cupin domain-containing protein n=1 Tax=Streptomyces sp. NBC_01450 TaxID=2903871 RepID=UPI002E30E6C2|nr:cupin domain-containing protein [Streptomyces sp. NBC_01450]
MSSAPPISDAETPDYYRPCVLHVPAGKGVVKWMSGDVYEIKATAESTNGAMGFIDCWVPPGNGPVAHVHKSADEAFYLISGALEFLNGDQTFVANAGDFVFVPKGTRHRFRNITDEETHMVAFYTPGGGEALFLEAGDDPVPDGKPEFWPPERGLALAALLGRKDIDMEVLPEEADFDVPADEA